MLVGKAVDMPVEHDPLLYAGGVRGIFLSFNIITNEISDQDIPGVAG